MSHVVFPILWGIGMLVFAGIIALRARLLFGRTSRGRLDRIPERIWRTITYGLGQKKFLTGEQPSGIMHALVFWGFVVLMLQVVMLFGRAFDADWSIPGFGADQVLGPPFFIARDLLEVVVIVGVLYMLYRRVVLHTPRLFGLGRAEQRYRDAPHWEGVLILVFILLIMVGGLLYDAGRLVADDIQGNERDFAPLAALAAAALGGLSSSSASTVSEVGWWLHCVTILVFLCLLPLSKHFHIITAIPNVFFGKLPPRGAERPLAITHVPAAPVAALDAPPEGSAGVASLADVSWKQVLDAFSCTECGRCTAVCPATASGTPLAPRQVILDIRDRLYEHPEEQRNGDGAAEPLISERGPVVVHDLHGVRRGVPGGDRARADDRRHAPQPGRSRASSTRSSSRRSRTTASRATRTASRRACAPAGPRDSTSRFRTRARSRWSTCGSWATSPPSTSACSSPRRASRGSCTTPACRSGCSTRASATRATTCAGSARRACSRCSSSRTWACSPMREFEAIFTTDPHSLNALRNEYPKYGLDKPVYHYTELLADLVARGVISLRTPLAGTRVTYHDPCYLARYNRITEAPRRLIEATGAELVEMPRHGTNTFCCGAGRRPDLDDGRRRDRGAPERAADPRGADARRARLLPRQLPEGPRDVLGRRKGRRRRLRGRGADRADRAGARQAEPVQPEPADRSRGAQSPIRLVSSSATSNRSATTP